MQSLPDLQKLVASQTEEAEGIKTDLRKAYELLSSCDVRLKKLLGSQEVKGTQKSLKEFIKAALNASNEPLTVKEISEMVLEAGYKTSSSNNFRNIVAQAMANDAEFKRKTRAKTRPVRYALEEV